MSLPVRVKICGITNYEDAAAAIDAGANALGFNLYPGSKRYVRMEEVMEWAPSLRGSVLRVAVMVNPSIEEIRAVHQVFDAVQLHGQESPDLCAKAAAAGLLWKAFPLAPDDADGDAAEDFVDAHAFVIDSPGTAGAFGGRGVLIDLDRAANFVRGWPERPVWLSGGLNPDNVEEAVGKVRPFGVDVASGVEMAGDPRRKDAGRVRNFIAAARAA